MRGYFRDRLFRIAVFFAVLMIVFLGFWLSGVRDEIRLRNENERRRSLLAQEEFLFQMMDEMERGVEKDWLAEAAARGLTGYESVRWNEQYQGAYLVVGQGFPATSGFLVTKECVEKVIDAASTTIGVYDRGEMVYIYSLTYHWD